VSRLVYYSLVLTPVTDAYELVWQLEVSIRSLRRFNGELPIVVFHYGRLPSGLGVRLTELGVTLRQQGDYEAKLAQLVPSGSTVLAKHPTLHRLLNLPEVASLGVDQALAVDADTVFLRDVDQLFKQHDKADLYAREEPHSRLSHYGYDPDYVDEDLLEAIAVSEGARFVPPFNCGVLLMSRKLVDDFAQLASTFLGYAWRFTIWMAAHPRRGAELEYAEGRGVDHLRGFGDRLLTSSDSLTALRFPSRNRWILEQVAAWLALGHVDSLSFSTFSRNAVLQAGEPFESNTPYGATVWHYFSYNTSRYRSVIKDLSQRNLGNDQFRRHSVLQGGTEQSDEAVAQSKGIVVRSELLECRLVKESHGIAVFEDVGDPTLLSLLQAEATERYLEAKPDLYFGPSRGDGRSIHPPRSLMRASGGDVQNALCHSDWLLSFMSKECGIRIEPTGEGGTYGYYMQVGDYIGLHLDVDTCDVVLITMLRDTSDSSDYAGSLVYYPDLIGKSISRLPSTGAPGGVAIKPQVGQSVILFGGVVPHYVAATGIHQQRVISVICFRAVPEESGIQH
jgi:hypothetical protein